MREEGLQARGAYKEVPRASRRLALATPESPWACTRVRAKITLTPLYLINSILLILIVKPVTLLIWSRYILYIFKSIIVLLNIKSLRNPYRL